MLIRLSNRKQFKKSHSDSSVRKVDWRAECKITVFTLHRQITHRIEYLFQIPFNHMGDIEISIRFNG